MSKVYGYGRVSREEQTVENQKNVVDMQQKIVVDQWFEDHAVSGKVKAMNRPQFAAMMQLAQKGDTIAFTRVDRIGRRASDILTVVEDIIVKGIEVYIFQIGDIPLSGSVGKMMLGFLAIFAENERLFIVERTLEGLDRTEKQGTVFGRPLVIDPKTLQALCKGRGENITLKALSDTYKIDVMTIHRNVKKWGDKMEEYTVLYNKQKAQIESNKAA